MTTHMKQYYEFVGLIPGNLAENEVTPIQKEIVQLVSDAGADIKRDEIIGRRKMAYTINNMRHAYYVLIGFEIEGNELATLEQKLRLHQNLMRYLITKLKAKTQVAIEKEQKRLAQFTQVPTEKKTDEPVARKKKHKSTTTKTSVAKTQDDKPVTDEKQVKPTKEQPVDLDKLEEKIDELLDAEIK